MGARRGGLWGAAQKDPGTHWGRDESLPLPQEPGIKPSLSPFQDINFSEKKTLFVFFSRQNIDNGPNVPFLLLCVERAFPPCLPQKLRPHPAQPPPADPHLAAPVSAERGGVLIAAERAGAAPPSPSPPPPLPQSQTLTAPPWVDARCPGSWGFWRLQAEIHFKLFEICLPFSHGD